jgi:hypothetical protein
MNDATGPSWFYLMKQEEDISIFESHDDPLDFFSQGNRWIGVPLKTAVEAKEKRQALLSISDCNS